jgi:hypothetical protein
MMLEVKIHLYERDMFYLSIAFFKWSVASIPWMSLEGWKENLLTKLSSQRWQVNICNISKYMLEGYITHIYQ